MPKLSIPIAIFAVLLLVAWRMARRSGQQAGAWPFLVLVLAGAVQALLVSLRWDFGITGLHPLQIMLSCLLPAVAWISFRSLSSPRDRLFAARDAVHLLPALLALIAMAVVPDAIDLIIIATFVGYGAACLRLALHGPNELMQVAFNGALNVQRALYLVTFTLFGSALVDLAVFLDFARGGGTHVPLLIGIGNLVWLVVIGLSAVITTGALPEEEPEQSPAGATLADAEDERIVMLTEDTLVAGGLYKDANLTLSRLARRCGVPARHISRAINRLQSCNVSQYVNGLRIQEACRLLAQTEMPVTTIIYESGFQTKSNFNREFLRVTGKTPREWRTEKGR